MTSQCPVCSNYFPSNKIAKHADQCAEKKLNEEKKRLSGSLRNGNIVNTSTGTFQTSFGRGYDPNRNNVRPLYRVKERIRDNNIPYFQVRPGVTGPFGLYDVYGNQGDGNRGHMGGGYHGQSYQQAPVNYGPPPYHINIFGPGNWFSPPSYTQGPPSYGQGPPGPPPYPPYGQGRTPQYGQPPPYGQVLPPSGTPYSQGPAPSGPPHPPYGQGNTPQYGQPPYSQAPPFAQPPSYGQGNTPQYGQPPYGQGPPPFTQPPSYGHGTPTYQGNPYPHQQGYPTQPDIQQVQQPYVQKYSNVQPSYDKIDDIYSNITQSSGYPTIDRNQLSNERQLGITQPNTLSNSIDSGYKTYENLRSVTLEQDRINHFSSRAKPLNNIKQKESSDEETLSGSISDDKPSAPTLLSTNEKLKKNYQDDIVLLSEFPVYEMPKTPTLSRSASKRPRFTPENLPRQSATGAIENPKNGRLGVLSAESEQLDKDLLSLEEKLSELRLSYRSQTN